MYLLKKTCKCLLNWYVATGKRTNSKCKEFTRYDSWFSRLLQNFMQYRSIPDSRLCTVVRT